MGDSHVIVILNTHVGIARVNLNAVNSPQDDLHKGSVDDEVYLVDSQTENIGALPNVIFRCVSLLFQGLEDEIVG